MPSNKAEWTNTVLAALALLGVTFGGYGHFSAVMAERGARLVVVEKEQRVSREERVAMDNELDVLWSDTTKNKDGVANNLKAISRNERDFEKFSAIAERLNISVVRLEERIGNSSKVAEQNEDK